MCIWAGQIFHGNRIVRILKEGSHTLGGVKTPGLKSNCMKSYTQSLLPQFREYPDDSTVRESFF